MALNAMQSAKPPVRIVVEVPHESGVQRVWALVPSHLQTVDDLAVHLSEKILKQRGHRLADVVLEIDGIPVAPDQDIAIIRDSDVVRVSNPTAPLTLLAPCQNLLIKGPSDSVGRVEGTDEARIRLPWNGTKEADGGITLNWNGTKEAHREGFEVVGKQWKPELNEEVDRQSKEFEEGGQEAKDGKKKRKKRDEEEKRTADGQAQAGAKEKCKRLTATGENNEPDLQETKSEKVVGKKKKRRKRDIESRTQGEGLLQLEWIQQTSRHSAKGSQEEQPQKDATLKGGGKRPKKKKEVASFEKDEPKKQTDEVRIVQKAPELMDQQGMQEDSSSEEEESESEAPRKEEKTPSRSARRKSAKRRYVRLAKEAAAREEAEGTRADMPQNEHQSMEGVEACPQNGKDGDAAGRTSLGPALTQHMRFDDSDSEGGGQKVGPARQPLINLNVGFGASGQPLSKERGKEWGKHSTKKKERHRNQNGRAEVPPPQQNGTALDYNGTYQNGIYENGIYQNAMEKSAEFRSSKRNGEPNGTTEQGGTEAAQTVGEERSEAEYERLPELDRLPQVADILAYRLVELTSSWTPQMSEYREGRVTAYDAASGVISLVWWPPEDATAKREATVQSLQEEEQEEGTVEAFAPPYDSDGNLQIEYSALMGVRLVQSSECTLAQLPEAPPFGATNPTSFASDRSPSKAEAAGELLPSASPIVSALEPFPATKPTPFVTERSPSSVLGGRESSLKQRKKEIDGKPLKVEEVNEADSKEQERQKGEVGTPDRRPTMALPKDEILKTDVLNGEQVSKSHAVVKSQESEPTPFGKNQKANLLNNSGLSDQGPQDKSQPKATERFDEKPACADIAEELGDVTNSVDDVPEDLPDVTKGSGNVTRGLGQTPQAWRQWESVAHLLSKRRAEIARQAALQKQEELKRLEEKGQEAEGTGNGLLQATVQIGEQKDIDGPEREEPVVIGTGAVASGKLETGKAGGTILGMKASLTEVQALVVKEGIPERSNGKHAETSKSEELPAVSVPESFRSEPLSSQAVPLSARQASDLPSRSPITNPQTGGPTNGDLVEARDLLASSGRKDDANENGPGSVGKKDDGKKNGQRASGVSVRGATKPRAPRLGALGPTLAYLRAQQNQLG